MPIFFFVGGFSNLVAYDSTRRKGESTWTFIRGRLERLLRPSIVFLGLWAVVQIVLHLADVGAPTGPRLWGDTTLLRGMKPPGATIPFGPLWFLGRLPRRRDDRAGSRSGCTGGSGCGCRSRWRSARSSSTWWRSRRAHWGWRWLNVAFVLLFPHQLGHAYADGTFARWPRRRFWAMVVGGLAGLVVLTTPWLFRLFGDARFDWFPGIGHYPKSLLGHRRRGGLERLPADRVLPARRRLDHRRRAAAQAEARPMAPARAPVAVHDRRERDGS